MINHIKKDRLCSETPQGIPKCRCMGINDKSYPTIYIRLGDKNKKYWFEFKNVDYLILS